MIFAIFIASLGLNTNSIPVIIGAMLISPLMGPIIGMGLAIGIQDFVLLKRGLKNVMAAMIGSILTSAIYFLISPQYEGSYEYSEYQYHKLRTFERDSAPYALLRI